VLDPAQNHTFRDHYLEVDLDLSKVLFIATANVIDTIPGPLLDRMEVIRLDGYTEEEKVAIARTTWWAASWSGPPCGADEVTRSPTTPCAPVVADYTREAGVRSLERELGRLLRKVATKLASGERRRRSPSRRRRRARVAGPAALLLRSGRPDRVPGVATGLAVTGAGGDVLFVEASMWTARGPDPDRSAGRRHEGVGGDRPVLRALPRRASSGSTRRSSPASGSTCTCRPARSPRTGRRPGSP
jgi:ATP-dependent Lon protease